MASCETCGGSVRPQTQCPHCGSFYIGESPELGDTALDDHRAGVSELSDAALGGMTSRLSDSTGDASASMPGATQASPSFKERTRRDDLDYWRLTRIPVLLILGWFTLSQLVLDSRWVFVDHANLALHEGGHLAFRWAGDTVYFLGGTIMQLLLPAAFTIYFWRWRKQLFAAAATLWWFGQNMLGIATYMADAPFRMLPLAGGNIHDWHHLFLKWDLLHRAGAYAAWLEWIGGIIMLTCYAALVWLAIRPSARELE